MPAFLNSLAVIFILTSLLTLFLFNWVLKNSSSPTAKRNTFYIVIGLIIWMIFQYFIATKGIYSNNQNAVPPMIARLGIFPALMVIILVFVSKKGRVFIDNLPLKQITYLNIVRIPVEFVLYVLAGHEFISQEMSFEGWNFDILAGITAPFIAYLGIVKGKIKRKWILVWNIISLMLLLFIVVIANLSAPSSFQMIFFESRRPFALFEFPYVWLPTFIVPIVLFGHLVSIRRLRN